MEVGLLTPAQQEQMVDLLLALHEATHTQMPLGLLTHMPD